MMSKSDDKWVFPDAPHTIEGQEKARKAWKRHMNRMFKAQRKHMVRIKGEEYVKNLEQAVKDVSNKNKK